jgi:hypothetical protein
MKYSLCSKQLQELLGVSTISLALTLYQENGTFFVRADCSFSLFLEQEDSERRAKESSAQPPNMQI